MRGALPDPAFPAALAGRLVSDPAKTVLKMTRKDIARSPLAFNGVTIHDKNENTIIPAIGLTEMDGEPRARDIEIAERLGFSRPRVIRELVERNRQEFEGFGPLAVQHGESRGQEFNEFWLNEEQALLVAALSKAPKAAAVRAMLIRTFVAWRRGHLGGSGAIAPEVIEEIRRTDGIARDLSHKVTEVERAVKRLEAMRAAPTFDLSGSVTSDTIIELAGVNRKERVRGTTVMITNAMLDFCDGSGCFRTPADLNPARPWRFPREKARDWLFGTDHGAERIRNQIGAQMRKKDKKGQRLLNLVPPPSQPPAG